MHDLDDEKNNIDRQMSKEISVKVPQSIINGINSNCKKSDELAKGSFLFAIKAGEFLIKAKEKVPHGQWKIWLQDNSGKTLDARFSSTSMASRYANLAKNKELALIINDNEVSFNLKDMNSAIANASEEDKEKAVHVSQNSGENEWYTPEKFIEAARLVMGEINFDPASSELANKTVRADSYCTKDDSGLDRDWGFGNVWMNPPYAQPLMTQFAEKLVEQVPNINQAIVLVNNATETKWFQVMAKEADAICFPSSRIKFNDKNGEPSKAPLQGQAFLYYGQNVIGFAREFSLLGMVVRHG